MTNALATSGTTQAEGFGQNTLAISAETAAAAVAAQAQASVQARWIIAQKNPRDYADTRIRLLKDCDRPGFAEAAIYHKPVGKGVEGPSIRFAEAALRAMGNVLPETLVIFDTAEKRIIRVSVTDLETNVTYNKDVVIEKTVERSSVRDGQIVLGKRQNSQGRMTYIVQATEDDLLNKQAALESKALRGLALRLLPGDILDECMERVRITQSNRDAADPGAAGKRLADSFAALGVMPKDLAQYLGHDLDQSTPVEFTHLRAVYSTLKDGEATWPDYVALREAERSTETGQEGPKNARVDALREKLSQKASALKRRASGGQDEAHGSPSPDGQQTFS